MLPKVYINCFTGERIPVKIIGVGSLGDSSIVETADGVRYDASNLFIENAVRSPTFNIDEAVIVDGVWGSERLRGYVVSMRPGEVLVKVKETFLHDAHLLGKVTWYPETMVRRAGGQK